MDEPTSREDLGIIVTGYLSQATASVFVNACVEAYVRLRAMAATTLVDGAGHRPAYSMRALCR